jgi:F-type H+-transporting ATPase subunit b
MTFSWTTFVVEIVNFIVLVWLLTRFLYDPVRRTLDERRRSIDAERKRAEDEQSSAAESKRKYDERLADWEVEKRKLRDAFDRSLEEDRARREAELRRALDREREQADAARAMRERDEQRRLRREASLEATRFSAQLLARVASPEVERKLIGAALEDLRALGADERATLARALDGRSSAVVATRFDLSDADRAAIADALAACLGSQPTLSFERDESLVCGIRIRLGAATLDGNIASDLRLFSHADDAR